MNHPLKFILLCWFLAFSSGVCSEDAVEVESQKERPRLYRGPYRDAIIESFHYGLHPLGYRGFYFPYFSPLMLGGPVMPGRSSVTFAVGSDGYVGTAFSTAERVDGTNIIYSLSASWEKGEDYFYGGDYQLTTISPSLSWANETTSIFLGFEISDYSLENKPVQPKPRPRVDTTLVRNEIPMTRDANPKFEYESIYAGLSQQIGDHTNIYISVGEDFFGRDDTTLGLSHRILESPSRHRR